MRSIEFSISSDVLLKDQLSLVHLHFRTFTANEILGDFRRKESLSPRIVTVFMPKIQQLLQNKFSGAREMKDGYAEN